jgi:hypothetical protein
MTAWFSKEQQPPESVRAILRSAHSWMRRTLPFPTVLDPEVARCGPKCEFARDSLYIGSALGHMLVLIQLKDEFKPYKTAASRDLLTSLGSNTHLARVAIDFANHFMSNIPKAPMQMDLERIAGDFVLNDLGMAPCASDELRGVILSCAELLAMDIGKQLMMRSHMCLRGDPPPW